MSTVLNPVTAERQSNNSSSDTLKTSLLFNKRKRKHGIKCKENYFEHKCNKALKNKLKKYKLRRDGKEDPEVLNVSHTFHWSLRIKSPNNNNIEELNINNIEERPKNYLFKMGRRKKDTESIKTVKTLFKDTPRDKPSEIQENNADTDSNEVLCSSSQERKHTNAFKIMMESRNKSIGSNSPGKEKKTDEDELQLINEEKRNKAKRHLILQKMAEAKGSLKNKEQEKLSEEAIKKKMEKRARRLTNMLVNNSCNEQIHTYSDKEQPLKVSSHTVNVQNKKAVVSDKRNGSLNLINMFHDADTIETNKKQMPREDRDFLNKLSPSIKKKENMLCYFKKLEKNDEDSVVTEDVTQNSPIIKVKFSGRNKNKLKKKLSLKTETVLKFKDEENCSELKDQVEDSSTSTYIYSKSRSDTRKRKREQEEINSHVSESNSKPTQDSLELCENNAGRPKRKVKKPTQYKDDFILSSSDEDYNIFTPKKKKQANKKYDTPQSNELKASLSKSTQKLAKSNDKDIKELQTNNDGDKKNNVKLAPIFATKPLLDPVSLEAKQKFLQSGVPEKLKEIASQLKQIAAESCSFPTVVHVQQDIPDTTSFSLSFKNLMDLDSETVNTPTKSTELLYRELLSPEKPVQDKQMAKSESNVRKVLQNIKFSYPKFPVYRTYHSLKAKSKGEFGDSHYPELDNSLEIMHSIGDFSKVQVDKLNWTDKYKPITTNQIIGNFETTRELKKWLETWSLNDKKKKNDKADSDSSDFCYSDTDSRDSIKTVDNLLILTGPTGCGKTACLYAVASELAIKVIEVNASSKRNGKIMIQDLQEATQSHKVNRSKGSTENSQKSQDVIEVDFTIKTKKRGRPKKLKDGTLTKHKTEVLNQPANSQESMRTGMSLILIDDADIVFDQDDGFCSAINQLVQSSKRPVILITTSLNCTHLQRFVQSGKIMKMKPLLPRMLGTWLDIMCLADSATCWPGLGAVLLDLFKGDIRKTINCLQFYASTHKQRDTEEVEEYSPSNGFHDENSSMSWAGSENQECQSVCLKTNGFEVDAVWKCFMEQQTLLPHTMFPADLCDIWWNVPCFFNMTLDRVEVSDDSDKQKQIRELNEITNLAENFSTADYLSCLRPDAKKNICSRPWYSSECDSSSECENFRYYRKSFDVSDELNKTLIVRSISNAKKNLKCSNELYVRPTSMTVQRERDRIISRHEAISDNLHPAAVLDRRALALDYWSSCRSICRFEKVKTDTNSKRNNRFCHYLRSLKMTCKSDVFEKIGDSLNVKENV